MNYLEMNEENPVRVCNIKVKTADVTLKNLFECLDEIEKRQNANSYKVPSMHVSMNCSVIYK